MEHARAIFAVTTSSLLAAVTPTSQFMLSLAITCAFNIWCGMRADGVSIMRCKNFSMPKFTAALKELFLYLTIIALIAIVTYFMGDAEQGKYAAKVVTYTFIYVYLQNGFKNLCLAYPTNKSLWMVYLILRLELKKALPSYIAERVEQYEKKQQNNPEEDDNQ